MEEPNTTCVWFERLCDKHGMQFPAISHSRMKAARVIEDIRLKLVERGINLAAELSLVVYGSLARGEFTSGSDVDWTLLVDGPADPTHFGLILELKQAVDKYCKPGETATFGTLASSHDLVHHIGGLDDTNRNMTRRLCLLLESASVDRGIVRDRVVRTVLSRYFDSGQGVPHADGPRFQVPRFLLNDVVRYWRTIAVDYAAKKWEQQNKKWAIRNVKLRVPRKMTFIKGLLLCFDCELFPGQPPWSVQCEAPSAHEQQMITGCKWLVEQTPIDLLCRALFLLDSPTEIVHRLLTSYDQYLQLVDDSEQRKHLERLEFLDAASDPLFREARDGFGKTFGDSLEELFFDDPQLSKLTKKYGLF